MKNILTKKSIHLFSKDYPKVKRLVEKSFPKHEQTPTYKLAFLNLRKSIRFTSYYDNNKFIGFTFSVVSDGCIFVLYLAVNDKYRGQGYGSKILSELKNNEQGLMVVLDIETLDENSSNYEQRLKRYKFYERNGFISTNQLYEYNDGRFLILSTDNKFKPEYFLEAFNDMFMGREHPMLVTN